MELKTKVTAEEGKHDISITRKFDLPLSLLFKAFVDSDIVEQWMNTKVLKLESKKHGEYIYETTDPKGYKHIFSGVIHELILDKLIIRTFEMENTNFGVQMEYYEFDALSDNTSILNKQIIFRSEEERNMTLKLPFVQGINMAHNRLEKILGTK